MSEDHKEFREKYLELNEVFDLGLDEIDKRLQYLCSDYNYGTTKSMVAYYLKYR